MSRIKTFIKYVVSSLSSTVVEYVFFILCLESLDNIQLSTYIGKFIGCVYQYLVNEKYVFNSSKNIKRTLLLFVIVNVFKGFMSANTLEYLALSFSENIILLKMIVDTVLFFMTYHVSKKYIF